MIRLLVYVYLLDVPVDIYRFGQICGDSKTGVWNTDEMISLMICGGGGHLGTLPEDGPCVNWIPVNYGAAFVADNIIDINMRTAPASERVHHVLNPHITDWSQLLEYLKSYGLRFTVIPVKEWLELVLTDPKNPLFVLAGFLTKILAESNTFQQVQYDMKKTINRSPALKSCPFINRELVQRYLNYWAEVGFLKQGYISCV